MAHFFNRITGATRERPACTGHCRTWRLDRWNKFNRVSATVSWLRPNQVEGVSQLWICYSL